MFGIYFTKFDAGYVCYFVCLLALKILLSSGFSNTCHSVMRSQAIGLAGLMASRDSGHGRVPCSILHCVFLYHQPLRLWLEASMLLILFACPYEIKSLQN